MKFWKIAAVALSAAVLLLLSEFLWKEGLVHFALHEVGFALMVSLIVWALFEVQLSADAETTWDRRIERLTSNVFQAVLRKDLPKGLIDEANNLVLNSSLIRRGFTLTYTLRDSTFGSGGETADCVLVDAVMEFSMENVSSDSVDWPVCLALPNPIHPDLKKDVMVKAMTVKKGGEDVVLEFEEGIKQFRRDLADNTQTAVILKAGLVTLEPGESCFASMSYTMAKEAEDTELLQTLFPADGLKLTIFDKAGAERRLLFARSVHRHKIETVSGDDDGQGVKIFKVRGYLLPHQGVLIWWKRKPNPPQPARAVAKRK